MKKRPTEISATGKKELHKMKEKPEVEINRYNSKRIF